MGSFFKNREVRIFFTVWIVYMFFISGYGGNWMADSMLGLTLSVVDDHSFFIDKYVKGGEDNAFFNGHYYSGFAPGASFLAVPVYFIFKPVFTIIPHNFLGYPDIQMRVIFLNIITTIFITSLLAALTSVFVYRFLNNFTKRASLKLLVTFIFSFATLYFLYATTFDSKIISTFFVFIAFYMLFNMKKSNNYKPSTLFFSGILLGFAVTTEYSQLISLALLSLYLLTFLRNRKIFYYALGVLIPLLFLLAYHQAVFGSPFVTPYSHRASAYANLYDVKDFGFSPQTAYGLSFSPFRGFFFYMPVMLLSFYGLYLGFRKKKYTAELLLVLLLFLGFFIYNVSLRNIGFWSAGCSFGPRHLLPVIPFIILPLAFITDKIGRLLVLILALISFFINLLPNLYGVTHLWTYKCMESNPLKFYLPFIFDRGLTNYTFNLILEKVSSIPIYLVNILTLFGLLIIGVIMWIIWKG